MGKLRLGSEMALSILIWVLSFVGLFGGTHLMAHLTGRDADVVVGWVALGAVCTLIARRPT